VYSVTNVVNGKKYIGQSSRPERRFAEHTWRGSKCKVLTAAIRKHGKANFEFKILCWCPDKAYADYIERGLIAAYDTRTTGYNICAGGEGFGSGADHPCYGRKCSDEERELKAASKRGALNPSYGKPNTPEQKAKIRAALLGRDITWGDKISAAKKGIQTISTEDLQARAAKGQSNRRVKVQARRDNEVHIFDSIRLCAEHFGIHEVCIQRYLRGTVKNRAGWMFTKVDKHEH
jgi:group I intron endonuclease